MPVASGTIRPAEADASSRIPLLVHGEELGILVARRVEPEGGLERDDGDVELAAVEEREPRVQVVGAEVELARALPGELENGSDETWRLRSALEAGDEGLGPQVLVEVERRHRLTPRAGRRGGRARRPPPDREEAPRPLR